MIGLKKLMEEAAESERKKVEKARLKKLKEEEKKKKKLEEQKEKKAEKRKALRIQYNRKYYLKRKRKKLNEKKKDGDVYGYTMVCIMKNRKKIKKLGNSWWRLDGLKIYNDAIEENKRMVKFPVLIEEGNGNDNYCHQAKDVKYEIVLMQRICDSEDNGRKLKDNETGKFVTNIIVDNEFYAILAKAPFYVEEDFNVYGYNPKTDRKEFQFIIDEIFGRRANAHPGMKRISLYGNKLVQEYDDDDFDFITAKNIQEAERLYNAVEKELNGRDGFIFLDEMPESRRSEFIDRMVEKTGWERKKIIKSSQM